ncbi:phosphate/phosphite/phosphonate ABC transporter substrate-binding protein [Cytobacillus sp. S13-E01]|uniref:phosphate/phosphite/phosphonate ABC transporter substrate-binding protein n=1 Tax=Cytobacillus sp. S13-E01 TaxID=3031326 RepID=UPI0023D87365|nr:phosphate/phosphite/phosphonate ABC transporter substrate-binding protein [Cytobacillus sp. S13-E01]MDF0725533.1 phosphate/phosphite/phosphonate ABC transporter substrate-binding protein [Cytobacillus sp. S13-E01]
MKKIFLIIFTLFLTLFLAACSEDNSTENNEPTQTEEETFTIGVIPSQTEGSMEGAMDKLQSILSKDLDRNVSVEVYPDYNGVVEAMNYDKIDMAFFGPLTYVVANEKSGAQAIITQLIDGEPFYHSYIITHKDNPLNSIEELVNNASETDFAFGDINSTSGSLIPSIELQDRGVYESVDEYAFNTVRFTGSHDATALSVQNKQVDAGAIDSAIYNQLVESGKIDGDQFKIIWESEKLFQYPWAVSKDTDPDTIKQLQDSFIAIEDEEIVAAFGATGFTTASNQDYESIRQAAIKQGIINE